MVGSAVASQEQLQGQEYARSMSTLWRLGRSAMVGASEGFSPIFEIDTDDYESIETLAYDDYQTALAEMLKTDPELRRFMEVESRHTYDVINNHVCMADGRPVVDMVHSGYLASKRAAEADERMEPQARRDRNDWINAQKVDRLKPGQSLFALSMDPKEQLNGDLKDHYETMGYRRGIAYLQWYSRTNNGLEAGAFSIDLSDEATWRTMFEKMGIELPEDLSASDWILHSFEQPLDPDGAQALAMQIRGEYYRMRQDEQPRRSLNEFIAAGEPLMRKLFEQYYYPLARTILRVARGAPSSS